MSPTIQSTIERLRKVKIGEVLTTYGEIYGYEAKSTHRDHLVRRIAWKLQAIEQGDVSEEAIRRALSIAIEAEPRRNPEPASRPSEIGDHDKQPPGDPRLPASGTELRREYRGRVVIVSVLAKGFEYDGRQFGSLSAVARAVTGTAWNGLVFFGLGRLREGLAANKQTAPQILEVREARDAA